MWTLICRVVGTAIAAACLAGAAHGQGIEADRSLTVDDLLGLEAFGRAAISPDGRWAIYERRGPYDTMPRIEANGRSTWQIMELWIVDLSDTTSPEERLLRTKAWGCSSPLGRRPRIISLSRGFKATDSNTGSCP